jgi:hypothetical protein
MTRGAVRRSSNGSGSVFRSGKELEDGAVQHRPAHLLCGLDLYSHHSGEAGPTTIAAERYTQRIVEGPTTSLLFERIAIVCAKRLGGMVLRDQALTIKILDRLLALLEAGFVSEESSGNRRYERSWEIASRWACLWRFEGRSSASADWA